MSRKTERVLPSINRTDAIGESGIEKASSHRDPVIPTALGLLLCVNGLLKLTALPCGFAYFVLGGQSSGIGDFLHSPRCLEFFRCGGQRQISHDAFLAS